LWFKTVLSDLAKNNLVSAAGYVGSWSAKKFNNHVSL
jgi:hypothetical protein